MRSPRFCVVASIISQSSEKCKGRWKKFSGTAYSRLNILGEVGYAGDGVVRAGGGGADGVLLLRGREATGKIECGNGCIKSVYFQALCITD